MTEMYFYLHGDCEHYKYQKISLLTYSRWVLILTQDIYNIKNIIDFFFFFFYGVIF